MKQTHLKLIILTLIIASVALAGCSYERKTPTQAQSTAQAGSMGVPTAALIAATTTPALAGPVKHPTALSIQATATLEPGVVGATTGSSTTGATSSTGAVAAPTNTPVTSIPVTSGGVSSSQEQIHVVQPGQNLFRIALQYGYDVDTIARYNGISNPEMIYVGQKIRIPGSGTTVPGNSYKSGTYVVQAGDTLLSIAAKFSTTTEALISANNLADANTIYVGQTLNVP